MEHILFGTHLHQVHCLYPGSVPVIRLGFVPGFPLGSVRGSGYPLQAMTAHYLLRNRRKKCSEHLRIQMHAFKIISMKFLEMHVEQMKMGYEEKISMSTKDIFSF